MLVIFQGLSNNVPVLVILYDEILQFLISQLCSIHQSFVPCRKFRLGNGLLLFSKFPLFVNGGLCSSKSLLIRPGAVSHDLLVLLYLDIIFRLHEFQRVLHFEKLIKHSLDFFPYLIRLPHVCNHLLPSFAGCEISDEIPVCCLHAGCKDIPFVAHSVGSGDDILAEFLERGKRTRDKPGPSDLGPESRKCTLRLLCLSGYFRHPVFDLLKFLGFFDKFFGTGGQVAKL